ncbi:mechanosensitive ion channel family protein [Dokdonia sp. Asnod3-C12]|uniref:mechanosensitive ion channel family protein n=1 Tax=Dokdonia sp. Asnod3-C12 TaxID=3160575 RepID=UPI00386757C4
MDQLEYIRNWFTEHPAGIDVIRYVLWVLFIVIIVQLVRKFLKKRLPNTNTRYKSQKAIEIVGYVFIALLSVSYFTGNIEDFTLAIGLFSAGIAFTLQELILSIAGSLYIFIVKVYAPGDRIEINGIKGDVIDIDSIYTTMMEIGEWVSSDNYSGRIVKLSNAFVFKGPIYNYSQDFPFIWDEFNLPIHHSSDMALTKEIITKVAQEVLADYVNFARDHWQQVVEKYYIEDALVAPTLAITLTDNWVQFNLRYIVDYKKRRITKDLLQSRIQEAILKTNDQVVIASTTLEVIKMPPTIINMTTTTTK